MTDPATIRRALAQQLASLAGMGVEQIGIASDAMVPPDAPGRAESVSGRLLPGDADGSKIAPGAPASGGGLAAGPVAGDPADPDVLRSESGAALRLAAIDESLAACTVCSELCRSRSRVVPGSGDASARLCFLTAAPGPESDVSGQAWDGPAGALLMKMLHAMGMRPEEVYLLHAVKCRPGEDRMPTAEELSNCQGFLQSQLAAIQPEFVCCLGLELAQWLLDSGHAPADGLRGAFHSWNGVPMLVTHALREMLRDPAIKRPVWEDMQRLVKAMGRELPSRK